MSDRIKPIIDSTYPALMAGLCLNALAISPDILKSKLLMFLVSTASFVFILSSLCIFINSVYIEWGEKQTQNKALKDKSSRSWTIGKWAFFFGVFLLLVSTLVLIYNLWFYNFLSYIFSFLSGVCQLLHLTFRR
ncbi:MAG: hypothetical protein K8S00_08640, partial [Bacteroidales bacterium]|nr:hypothetical protein [Bacteroidales bacterium]